MADINAVFEPDETTKETFYLTQTEEWVRFTNAVSKLPDEFSALKKLAKDSVVTNTEELSVEFEMLNNSGTSFLSEFSFYDELVQLVGEGDENETLIIGDI